MYYYETHLHTAPVSPCARATVRETLEFYKKMGYDGVCLTNHLFDKGGGLPKELSYEGRIRYYCAAFEEGKKVGAEIGLKVFFGFESGFGGTDFLVYGIDGDWLLAHPEWTEVFEGDRLNMWKEAGAFIVQAHPFRLRPYIDHIRLFEKQTDGVEIINASQPEEDNHMAKLYAERYGKICTAGSDNHVAGNTSMLAGVMTEEPLSSIEDYIAALRAGKLQIFTRECPWD